MKRRHLLQALPALGLAPAAQAGDEGPWLLCGQELLQLQPESLQVLQRNALPWRPELPAQRQGETVWLARRSGELLALDLRRGTQRQQQLEGGLQQLLPSADGAWLLAASAQVLQLIDTGTLREAARHSSHSALLPALALPARRSLLLAPRERAELWELYLDPGAEDFYEGLVHDFRFGEGVPTRGFLGRRRMALAAPAQALWQHPAHFHVALLQAPQQLQMFNLDARRPAGRLTLQAALQAACSWQWQGQPVLVLGVGHTLQLVSFDRAEGLGQQALGRPGEPITQLLGNEEALFVQAGTRLLRLDAGLQPQAEQVLPGSDALHRVGTQLWARSAVGWTLLDAHSLRPLGVRACAQPASQLLG
ncbi:hypothetical protein [Inhella sp.]|uniref:hypothetical protein n=1 Tax=Inhella sp. TaxID=1921806 RepID=UPI0035B40425